MVLASADLCFVYCIVLYLRINVKLKKRGLVPEMNRECISSCALVMCSVVCSSIQ